MSEFGKFGDELPATLEEEKPGSGATALYNLLTFVFLGLSGLAALFVIAIFLNPNAAYNPFPPNSSLPTPTLFVIPSSTPTLEVEELPPTWTPSVTPSPVGPAATEAGPGGGTAEATPGGEVEATPTPLSGQATPPAFPFVLQEGAPAFTQNPEENGGCDFLGMVGQVFDLNSDPIDGIAVVVVGENFEQLFITQFTHSYGPGSYQIELNNAPLEAEFEVQLWSVSAEVLSDTYVIRTRPTCEENLIFVNFVQVGEANF